MDRWAPLRNTALAWDTLARQSLIWRMMSPRERIEHEKRQRLAERSERIPLLMFTPCVRFWLRWSYGVGAAAGLLMLLATTLWVLATHPAGPSKSHAVVENIIDHLVVMGIAGVVAIPLWFWEYYAPTRKVPVWMCRACGYDLRGLDAHAVCPECGRPPKA
jgi:hypothetical protein